MKHTVGIIGAGSFGVFMAEQLEKYCQVKLYSHSGKQNAWSATIDEVASCDYLVPCIPIDSYQSMLSTIKPLLKQGTVIVDICSVKEEPVRIIRKVLPQHAVVATHPLFGPESVSDSLAGHVLVLCPEVSDPEHLSKIEEFAKYLGLRIVQMSAQEHDREMAVVQGLTFFIAHALKDLGLQHQKLETPSFRRLLHLSELEAVHSEELFYTIQRGNPQTAEVREKFIEKVGILNAAINNVNKETVVEP